jgi:hypothetical protein
VRRRPPRGADVLLVRYLDVCLVLATAPFAIAGGLPLTGYAIAAGAWLLTRVAAALLTARALRAGEVRTRIALQFAAMSTRVWIVALAVILARTVGGRSDGIMAAALSLAAFTVYLGVSYVTRPAAARTAGRPRTS